MDYPFIFLLFLGVFILIAILIIIGPTMSKDVLNTGNNTLGSYISFLVGYSTLNLTPRRKETIKTKYGPTFEGYTNDSVLIKILYLFGTYEPYLLAYMMDLDYGKDGILVDIGANEGFFSIIMGYNGVKTYAIEPSPDNVSLFKNNIKINNLSNKITIFPYAAGNYDGTIDFKENRINRMWSSVESGRLNFLYKNIEVPIRKVENLIDKSEWNKIKLIKIDVEGYEKHVLDGMLSLLDYRIIWIIEVDTATETYDDIVGIFTNKNYTLKYMDMESVPFKWNQIKCKDFCTNNSYGVMETTIKNIIFIPPK